MRSLIAALMLAAAVATPAHAVLGGIPGPDGTIPHTPYFDTLFRDPAHPKVSATVLYTPKLTFDGGLSDVAVIFHKGNPNDSLWPQQLLDAGFPPVSWTLLELGAGGNSQTGFIHFGASVNVAPTILGPLVAMLNRAGGTAAVVGGLLSSPNGGGVKVGFGWKSDIIENGGLKRLNEMTMPPRYGFGYNIVF